MDKEVFKVINKIRGRFRFLDNLAIFFAKYFEYIFWPIFVLSFYNNLILVLKVLLVGLFSRFIIAWPIAGIIKRKRPYQADITKSLIGKPYWFSFPSGHASFYFALSGAMFKIDANLGILFFTSAILISFFRVYSGVHYLSDILAGAVIGITTSFLI